MTNAWNFGPRTCWLGNVGDLKPAELSNELFLHPASNLHARTPENINDYST